MCHVCMYNVYNLCNVNGGVDMVKQRDGFLAPYKWQKLRWIVPGRWAAAAKDQLKNIDKWELFYARPSEHVKCGYKFKFAYEFRDLEEIRKVVPELIPTYRNMKDEKWSSLVHATSNLSVDEFMQGEVLDHTWITRRPPGV